MNISQPLNADFMHQCALIYSLRHLYNLKLYWLLQMLFCCTTFYLILVLQVMKGMRNKSPYTLVGSLVLGLDLDKSFVKTKLGRDDDFCDTFASPDY